MDKEAIEANRDFLKDTVRKVQDFSQTDQSKGIAPPPLQKPYPKDGKRIELIPASDFDNMAKMEVRAALLRRASRRNFTPSPLGLRDLSFLLWATQGVVRKIDAAHAYRTVPSAGCRHAFETYVISLHVRGLDQAVYRYLPLEHQLLYEFQEDNLPARVVEGTFGQGFVGTSAAVFVWTAIPYRMEWRYGLAAHKVILLDAGHVCQNLYIACEGIAAGTCAVAAYDQDKMDELLRLDGNDEFTVYLAPVGHVASS